MLDLAFDIGAHKGENKPFFDRLAKRTIYFEPNPNLVIPDVVIDKRGISNKTGSQQFYISNYDVLSTFSVDWINHSRFSNKFQWKKPIIIETTTLNCVIEEYGIPGYIKVDVEGHELEVFLGLSYLLDNTIICFEWVKEFNKTEQIIEHVKNLGYKKFSYTLKDKLLLPKQIQWSNELNIDTSLGDWGMVYFRF